MSANALLRIQMGFELCTEVNTLTFKTCSDLPQLIARQMEQFGKMEEVADVKSRRQELQQWTSFRVLLLRLNDGVTERKREMYGY